MNRARARSICLLLWASVILNAGCGKRESEPGRGADAPVQVAPEGKPIARKARLEVRASFELRVGDAGEPGRILRDLQTLEM